MSCNPTSPHNGGRLTPSDFPMTVRNARILLMEAAQIAGRLSSRVADLMQASQHLDAEAIVAVDRVYGRLIEFRPVCAIQHAAMATERDPDAPWMLDPLLEAFLGQADELACTLPRANPVFQPGAR